MELPVQEYVMFELRVVICFLTAKEKAMAEIHRQLVQMCEENYMDV